jgi:hypothetical protein
MRFCHADGNTDTGKQVNISSSGDLDTLVRVMDFRRVRHSSILSSIETILHTDKLEKNRPEAWGRIIASDLGNQNATSRVK